MCSAGHHLLEERMKIASELWSVDIAVSSIIMIIIFHNPILNIIQAEYNHSEKYSLEELVQHCRVIGVAWMVILRDRGMNSVRIRSLEGRGEVTVLRADITATLLHAITHNELLQMPMDNITSNNITNTTRTSGSGRIISSRHIALIDVMIGTGAVTSQSVKDNIDKSIAKPQSVNKLPNGAPMLDVVFVAPLETASKAKRKIQRLALSRVEPLFSWKSFANVKVNHPLIITMIYIDLITPL